MKIAKKILIFIICIIGFILVSINTKAKNENLDTITYLSQYIKPKISYQEACARPDAIWAINYYAKHGFVDKEGLLIAAEKNPNEKIVNLLLSSANFDEASKNNALWKSLTNSNLQVCKLIIDAGANVNDKNAQGETPLIVAYTKGHAEIMSVLLAAGADANVKNANGETLLQIEYSKEKPSIDVMKKLIDNCANTDVKNPRGETLLQSECAKDRPNIDIIRILINGGATPNVKDNNGETPLSVICLKGNSGFLAILEELIKGKADVNVKNKKGETLLQLELSKEYPNLGVITALIKGGADINVKNTKGETLLQVECKKQSPNIDIIRLLISGGADVNAKNAKGETPLFMACSRSSADTTGIVKGLIDGDANIEEKNSNGETPLIVACANGKLNIAAVLINSGADIEAKNKKGETPLLAACSNGRLTVVSFLITKGANIDVRNNQGETPINIARNNNHYEVVKYFEKLQAEKLAKEKADAEARAKRRYVDSVERQMVFIPSENIEVLSTEVTQEIYEKVMGANPSKNKGNKNPVENVSWFDAILFCNKLSVMGGLTPVYSGSGSNISVNSSANGFRLPTIFEWVAAAEGGNNYLYAGGDSIDEVAWYSDNSAYNEVYLWGKTHPVAQKKANGYGLYDMSGNVYEWCWDKSTDHSHYRFYMGGCYNSSARDCEIASLRQESLYGLKTSVSGLIRPYTEKDDKLGFRIVRNMTSSQKAEEEAKAKAEVEKEKVEAEAKAKAEEERAAKEKAEAEAKARAEAERAAKQKAEVTAKFIRDSFVDIPGKNFAMMRTEVTQEEYLAVMGKSPSHFKGYNFPVEQVSWYDAIVFCNAASAYVGLEPVYSINENNVTQNRAADGFRLPTEDEWEYAAKGGNDYRYSGSDYIDDVAWFDKNSESTHPVAKKKPNDYGLYDMSGNVWEWCWDDDPYDSSRRIGRGGSWYNLASNCEVSSLSRYRADERSNQIGFRIVRNIK